MAKRKKYTIEDIETVEKLKREYPQATVRGIAETTGISKTQVGNWLKYPEKWKEKYRFNIPDDKVIKDKEQLTALEKFKKKVHRQRKNEPEAYKGLYIRYEDGGWEAYSG